MARIVNEYDTVKLESVVRGYYKFTAYQTAGTNRSVTSVQRFSGPAGFRVGENKTAFLWSPPYSPAGPEYSKAIRSAQWSISARPAVIYQHHTKTYYAPIGATR